MITWRDFARRGGHKLAPVLRDHQLHCTPNHRATPGASLVQFILFVSALCWRVHTGSPNELHIVRACATADNVQVNKPPEEKLIRRTMGICLDMSAMNANVL